MNQSRDVQSDSVVQDQTQISQDVQSDSVVQPQTQISSPTVSVPIEEINFPSSNNTPLSTQDIIKSHQT